MRRITFAFNSLFVTLILSILIGCSGLSTTGLDNSADLSDSRNVSRRVIAPGGDDALSTGKKKNKNNGNSSAYSRSESRDDDDDDDRDDDDRRGRDDGDDDDRKGKSKNRR